MAQKLWVELFRPATVSDYVFADSRLRAQVRNWIQEKTIPHILFAGPAGTGKSSLARVLINELKIPDGDVLYINASDQTGVDVVREKIQNFVCTIPIGEFKIVLLEEADHISINGQAALRRVMEDYADESRFILTCNYANKIIPAIQSRCQTVILDKLDEEEFICRVISILETQAVSYDAETIDIYIRSAYPDLRKCINNLQLNTIDGVLVAPSSLESRAADWQVHAVELFNKGKITEARKFICERIRVEEFEDLFRLCYRNLQWWSDDEALQEQAIVIIRDAIVKDTLCADREINASAMLCELARIKNS